MEHRPSLVVLSKLFAGTRRGAELIGRIQTDATLTHCQIRVLSDAGDYLLLVAEHVTTGSCSTLEDPGKPPPPQYNGTRAAQRVRIGEGLEVRVDGNPVTLVDLSPTGAQVCVTATLRPYQRVRLVVVDGLSMFRFAASVVWVSFEPRKAKGPPQTIVEADVGIKKSRKPRRRAASLRELPSGTPVVIKRRGKEEVVVLVRVK